MTIALDAMGGDNAPASVVEGAEGARQRNPDVHFLFFGNSAEIEPLLDRYASLRQVSEVIHTDVAINDDMKPSTALRAGRKSSMRMAIDSVSRGDAACAVSAGNTGALMAMAKIVLKTLPGIDRPAIASILPTLRGESVMLDLGANVDCDADNLVQFAIMGAIFARIALGVERPTCGLLNIGAEELKGNEAVKAAATALRQIQFPGSFEGFLEGNEIAIGTVDVVVTDGFTGNVALKTAEGTSKLYTEFLRRALTSSFMARLGYLLAKPAFRKLRLRTDPRRYNGAMFLGLQGICVKSHGNTDGEGFANAVCVAVDLARYGVNDRISEEMTHVARVAQLTDAQAAAG